MADQSMAGRMSKTSEVCEALGRVHSAVDTLHALRTELHEGQSPKGTAEVATPQAPAPPLAELLQSLPRELNEICNRVESLVGEMRELLI